MIVVWYLSSVHNTSAHTGDSSNGRPLLSNEMLPSLVKAMQSLHVYQRLYCHVYWYPMKYHRRNLTFFRKSSTINICTTPTPPSNSSDFISLSPVRYPRSTLVFNHIGSPWNLCDLFNLILIDTGSHFYYRLQRSTSTHPRGEVWSRLSMQWLVARNSVFSLSMALICHYVHAS
jgi:hypothetical protein